MYIEENDQFVYYLDGKQKVKLLSIKFNFAKITDGICIWEVLLERLKKEKSL